MISHLTLKADHLRTLDWYGDKLVDWASGGNLYSLDGNKHMANSYHAYGFDKAITSRDLQYSFIYKRKETKGLLLKDGDILREINRSHYFADAYEYPAAFATLSNGKTYLIHCPMEYCRLDMEDVETGELVTTIQGRAPADVFHSRLEVSPDNRHLLSKGWVWHPWDVALLFNLESCLENPALLDENNFMPAFDSQIWTAGFIDEHHILFGAGNDSSMASNKKFLLPPCHIAVWDIATGGLSTPVEVKSEFGHLIPIDGNYAWDLYKYPKIINLNNGNVEEQYDEIVTGTQRSSIDSVEGLLHITFNRSLQKLAIGFKDRIEILSFRR